MKRVIVAAVVCALACACATRPFVIVQIADAQLGFTAAQTASVEGTAYVNDMTFEAEYLKKAVTVVNELRPDVVVFTGDQVNYPDNNEQWELFAGIISEIDSSVKVYHLPGNHDVFFTGDGVDSGPFTERYGPDRFVCSERGVRIVGINSNLIRHDDSREAGQFEWLKTALDKEGDEVTVLFGHHPFFMNDIDEEDGYFQIQKSKRHAYMELFHDKDVDAVYAGHRHDSSEGSYKGIPVRTTTSVAFQIGDSNPSVRIIEIADGTVSDRCVAM